MKNNLFRVTLVMSLLTACNLSLARPTATVPAPSTLTPTVTFPPPTPTFTPPPSPSPTPDPFAAYSIDNLRARAYGGGEVQITEKYGQNSAFARYLIRYPSDGLTIAGFMDVPNGEGPFPVVIALHGYVSPSVYSTLDYTTHYADTIASAGYLVLHPNLRSFPPSDDGDTFFRVGMAIDALNLIAIVRQTGGQPGALQQADPAGIGMWGHSMGGGVTTRVLTVSPDVKAAVLYAPVSGDEQKNYIQMGIWSNSQRGSQERAVSPEDLQRISPVYYYGDVQAVVSIHQGLADQTIPPEWSQETCRQLQEAGKTVECHYYAGQPHTFRGQADRDFIRNTIQFFDQYLRG